MNRLGHMPAYRKPPRVGAEYDGGLFGPGTVLDEMKAVDGFITSLGDDFKASQVDAALKEEYAAFEAEWAAFYADNKDILSRVLNKTYAMVLEYRERYNDWRRVFVEAGGSPTTPEPPGVSKRYGGQGLVRTVLIVGGVVGAAVLAWRHFGPKNE